jgi:hypothetical protein
VTRWDISGSRGSSLGSIQNERDSFLSRRGIGKGFIRATVPSTNSRRESDKPPSPRFIVFEGKQDLEKRMPKKLRGYLNPRARFIVMRDQDQGDCRRIKRSLAALCPVSHRPRTIIRIACHELESFYLGDLQAVESGLGVSGLAGKQNKAKFRDPDHLSSPSRELEKLTGKRYQKIAGSRAIAPHLDLRAPRSRSFRHLLQAVRSASLALHSSAD